MTKEEYRMLQEVLESGAFEIQKRPDHEHIYDVPYMMNDALECYLVFTGASMQGEFLEDAEEETTAIFTEEAGREGLIIRQGNVNTCTLWFEDIHKELKLYRFDEIGHFWEKDAHLWRRLVYLIGTMEDKYLFLGDEVCNAEELALIPLMGFVPFYRYYPASVCIPEEYVMTEEGCRCMLALAEEAGDRSYAAVIHLYLKCPGTLLGELLHRMLRSGRRKKLYELICKIVERAAMQYPARDYGEANNRKLREKRTAIALQLQEKGYEGTYPDYRKGEEYIRVMEEHPFTRMEDFDRGLRFHLVVNRKGKITITKNLHIGNI